METGKWVEKLVTRLVERLYVRISALINEKAGYEVITEALMKAVGETPITYGHRIFKMNGEAVKAMSGDEIVDLIGRNCRGLFQGAKSVEDCVFALAMAITRQIIPCGGKVFMENRTVTSMRELRECWCNWMSGRMKGNFLKMLGGSSGGSGRSGKVVGSSGSGSRTAITCFVCGEAGHRAIDCRARKGQTYSSDKPSSSAAGKPRPLTCYSCHQEGHKSTDCLMKKIETTIKKEPGTGRTAVVNKTTPRGGGKKNVIRGKVNGKEVCILVDTGADYGLVPRAVVPDDAEDCGERLISGVHGDRVLHKCTKAMFDVAGLKLLREVVIDDSHDGSLVNCILPLDLRQEEEVKMLMGAVKSGEVNVLTRSQVRAEAELDRMEGDIVVKPLDKGVGNNSEWCTLGEEEWCTFRMLRA